jgi:hypothetical protein
MLRRYSPISTAIGIVPNTVAVAHGLCFMALTTTRPSTAIRMIMIVSVPMIAGQAADRAELVARHLARLRPSRRVDMNRMVMSWTQPPSTAPTRIHNVPGR